MKYAFAALLVSLAYLLASCDATEVGEPPPVEEEPGLFVFAAEFNLNRDARLVLAPFDDPAGYRILEDLYGFDPRFSPDKSTIVFKGYREDNIQSNYLYDVEGEVTIALLDQEAPNGLLRVESETVVWDEAGSGFYFDLRGDIGNTFVTYYHALGDSSMVFVNNRVSPVERIGRDTLIVKMYVEGGPAFFFLDLRSGELSPLNNPHLDIEARWSNRALDWHEEKRLLVFVDVKEKEGQRDSQIAITNLDGSFYRALTTGVFSYGWPRWGPNDEVLFRRKGKRDSPSPAEIATVHIETAEVRTLLRLEDLGALELYFLDY